MFAPFLIHTLNILWYKRLFFLYILPLIILKIIFLLRPVHTGAVCHAVVVSPGRLAVL